MENNVYSEKKTYKYKRIEEELLVFFSKYFRCQITPPGNYRFHVFYIIDFDINISNGFPLLWKKILIFKSFVKNIGHNCLKVYLKRNWFAVENYQHINLTII